jgi:hypothetical protein
VFLAVIVFAPTAEGSVPLEAAPVPAGITSPPPGSTVSGSTTFHWTSGSEVSAIWLDVGTTAGGSEIYAGAQQGLSRTVHGIPRAGDTVRVRLWSLLNGIWSYTDYTYATPPRVPAGILSPAPGSTLTAPSVTFTWTSGTDVSAIWLDVGTTAGGSQIYAGAQQGLSRTVQGVPRAGHTVYVRLWSLLNGIWSYTDYAYATPPRVPAGILSPVPGSTLSASNATFTWTSGTDVSVVWLDVGTTLGGAQLYAGAQSGLSRTITGIPIDGLPVYVRLWSLLGSVWSYTDYTYPEVAPAELSSPADGSQITSGIATFTWSLGASVSVIWLDVGVTPGGSQIYAGAQPPGVASRTVSGLPINGSPVHVRLWSLLRGQWHYSDYSFPTKFVTDVRDYGAVGDGVTDDSEAIQAAIDSGSAIHFPAGHYYIGQTTIRLRRFQTLFGDGHASTGIRYDGTGDAIRYDVGHRNSTGGGLVTVRDLYVEGLNPANAGTAISVIAGGHAYYLLDRLHLKGHFKYGVVFDQAEIFRLKNSIVANGSQIPDSANVWLTSGDEYTPGAVIGFTSVMQLENNEFRGARIGVMDDGGNNHGYENNHFIGHAIALRLAGASSVLVVGNTFETPSTSGEANVLFTTTSGVPGGSVPDKGPVYGGVIEGNTFAGAVAPGGALLKFAAASASHFHTGFSITGNHFETPAGRGVAVDVTQLGQSFVGYNGDDAAGSHYGGVHNGPYENTLLVPSTTTPVSSVPISLLGPEPGSTVLGSSVLVSWTSRASVSAIWLDVGTTLGGTQIYAGAQAAGASSRVVSGLPIDGSTVYVRLWALGAGVWRHRDYTFTSASAGVNVRDYGAIGDGWADDSAAIQAALDAASTVYVPPGAYYIGDTTLRLRSGQTLYGAGYTSSGIFYDGAGDAILFDSGHRNASGEGRVALHDLYLFGENPTNTGAGVDIVGGGLSRFRLDRLYIRGAFKYGVVFDQAKDSHLSDSVTAIDIPVSGTANVWITNGDEHTPGMAVGFSSGIVLRNNQFNAGQVGVMDDGGPDHVIEYNNFNGNPIPLRLAGASSVRIKGNTFENQLVSGEANVLFTTTSGVSGGTVPDKGPSSDGTIKGNTFAGGVGPGAQSMLRFSAASPSVFHTGFVVTANHFEFRYGRGSAIDVTRLGNSFCGYNQDDATTAYIHYGGVHNGTNTLLPPARPH